MLDKVAGLPTRTLHSHVTSVDLLKLIRKMARQLSSYLGYSAEVYRFVIVVTLLVALSGCHIVFSEAPNQGLDASGDAVTVVDGVGIDSDPIIVCTPFCDPRGLVCGTALLQGCVDRCVAAGPANGEVAHCNGFEPSNVPANESWGSLGQVDGELVLADGVYSMHSDTGEIVKDATQDVIRKGGSGIIAGIQFKTLASGLGFLGVSNLRIGANATVNVVGPVGLVIVARNNVDIAGDIDASAHVNPGPGGGLGGTELNDATGCGRGVRGKSGLSPEAGGGGSGGAFGTVAGNGGGILKADARGPCSGTLRATLLGGSGGGAAGAQNYLGVGGAGGGALQITAGHSIVVRGRLAANGSGGAGADSADSGGSGGGSG